MIIRLELVRTQSPGDRFVDVADKFEGPGDDLVCVGSREALLDQCDDVSRFIGHAAHAVVRTEVGIPGQRHGIDFKRLQEVWLRLVHNQLVPEPFAVGVVRVRIVGIELHRAQMCIATSGQITQPVIESKRVLDFRDVRIDRQRPEDRFLCRLDVAEIEQRGSEPAMRQRRIRVCFGRLPVKINGPHQHTDIDERLVPNLLIIILRQEHQLIRRGVE